MTTPSRTTRRRTDGLRRLGTTFVVLGALVVLTPLALWRARPPAQEALPIIVADVSEAPAPEPVQPPVTPPAAEAAAPTQGAAPAAPASEPQAKTPQPAAEQPGQSVAIFTIEIERIGIMYSVLPGIEDHHLIKGPGHYPNTPLPGSTGNAAVAGHRTVKGKASYFYAINKLQPGDPIWIHYPDRSLTFTVERVFMTTPFDRSVLAPTESGTLTLTTCDPPGGDERRLIVQARFAGTTVRP